MWNRGFWALVLLLLVVSAFINSGPLLMLTILLALTGGASALWGRYALTNLTYRRDFPSLRLAHGESTDLWIEVVNAKLLPLAWIRIDDEWPAQIPFDGLDLSPSGRPARQLLTNLLSLRWYERVRRRYRITAARRGAYDLGPVVLTSGDMFGFRSQTRTLPSDQTLIVHPRILPLHQLGLDHARPFGDQRARRLISPDPLKLAGARHYVPGDNPRHLHWKATAHRGQLQTRLFDPGADPHVLLFLNVFTSDQGFQSYRPALFEQAIEVTASLAAAAAEQRFPLGLFVNGNRPGADFYARLPASRHPDQLARILDALAALTFLSTASFENLLRTEAQSLPFGATVMVISAVANESLLASLLQIQSAGHPVVLVRVGPGPFAPVPDRLPSYTVNTASAWSQNEVLQLD